MDIQEFLSCVRNQMIPPAPPDGVTINGYMTNFKPEHWMLYWEARRVCNELGMWPIVDEVWTQALAKWIGNKTVLEVMAGGGWIAKALHQFGVNIIATDDFSWANEQHKKMTPVFHVKKLDAIEATKLKADILLISWPPYGDETIIKVCDAWGTKRPIIYIGETDGGCNAPEGFFANFKEIDDQPSIPLMCWDGFHDHIFIGYWGMSLRPSNNGMHATPTAAPLVEVDAA